MPTQRRKLGIATTMLFAVGLAYLNGACHHAASQDPTTSTPAAEDDDTTFAEDAADTNATEADAQLVTSSLISSATGTIGLASDELANDDLSTDTLGDGVRANYIPRACVDVTTDSTAQTVTYTFTSCLVGPNGLAGISGAVSVHYTTGPSTLHLDITATGLKVNASDIDFSATADVSASGTSRTMVWKAQLTGTTAGGRDFSRTNAHTVSWTVGDACFELDGTSEGKIKQRDIRIDIANFKRCRRGCPEADGKITITNVPKQRQIELLYNGTNIATFVGPAGKQTPVQLLCKG
jgi:hypothetical protein